MEHLFFATGKSGGPVHRLDPRVKIICTVAYIICVVLTAPSAFSQFALFLTVILTAALLSRIPPGYVLKRSLVIFPFVLLVVAFVPFLKKGEVVGSYGGLWVVWNVLVKSWLSVLAMILLGSTTDFQMLLKGLECLHFPKLFLMTIAFMYRYIFIIVNEAMRMERAHRSRYFGGQLLRQVRIIGNMVGLLFIRAYERGERVYQSMCARGFDGEIRTLSHLKFKRWDMVYISLFLAAITLIKIV